MAFALRIGARRTVRGLGRERRFVVSSLRSGMIRKPFLAVQPNRLFSTTKDDDEEENLLHSTEGKQTPDDNKEVIDFLSNAVKEHPVLLFMKGTPENPRCGFSSTVVQILNAEGVSFSSADVLASDAIRQGIKDFSQWPTIPQLYVDGEFIGGSDIVLEMHKEGELKKLLEKHVGKSDEK